ncbi:Receptor expression-enhancing protein 5 (Polyposis locus protein 1 homolog) [Durusdinium trenchii]|uniref:Receptor expression-enhancing protein 5 (Polyposis locus protein 1 homolog) n=1 Tax=Durusdinium trenchii TaxID=1381693 RepID=A0ABP0K5F9_9DINO
MFGFILSPIEFVLVTAYAPLVSLKALESKSLNDDTNMLAFWVTWTILSAVENITWGAIWIFPFYTELRFGLLVYMLFFEGGKTVYRLAIDPAYQKAKKKIPAELMEQLQTDPKAFLMTMVEKGKEQVQQLMAKQGEAPKADKSEKKKKQAK